jgi:hypothetical protein
MPALSPTEDLEGLEESPTVGMKLGRSKVEVMQNFNPEVRRREPNL